MNTIGVICLFKEYNCNPKKLKTGDCVIRSFSLASGKTWEETLTDLFEIGLKLKTVPNDQKAYERYASDLGFVKKKVEIINGKKPTVSSFARDNPKGIFILRVANHLVTVKDGYYWDSWDCGNKSVYAYWKA